MKGDARWLSSDTAPAALSDRTHTILVPGASAGGPRTLEGSLITMLIEIEAQGQNTMLIAHEADDLATAVATVCRYVVASDRNIIRQAELMWGSEQVVGVRDLTELSVRRACRRLATPPARTWQRRIQARSARLRRLHARVRKVFRH